MARTRADIEAQVADDLARTDLSTQITTTMDWALNYYADDRFFFNEVTHASVTLSSSLNFMPLTTPPQQYKFLKFDRMRVLLNGMLYEVIPSDYDLVMAYQDGNTLGRPCNYCIHGDKVQFDTMADQNYALDLDGIVSLGTGDSATFTAASEAAWFNIAGELMRSAIKRNLYGHIIKDERMASMAVEAEQDAYSMLKGMTTRKKSSGFIKPRWF